ncbi:MAG TPA: outer membrane lipoprotein-sorting protein [Nevskiaceae bacterium]|nr:outer membrane lipoprotein-sorting protein [Nevskiaceae bacterium]
MGRSQGREQGRALRRLRAGLGLALLALTVGANATPKTAEEIGQCMRTNLPMTLQVKEFELKSLDKGGSTRVMQGRLYATREDNLVRSMLSLQAPADMRGAAYLMREAKTAKDDEMYVYLPALNKTRRILGGSKDNPLFGTDISYADIKQINHAFTGGEVTLEGSETFDGRPVWRLSMKPDPAVQSRFERIHSWVDQASCVALKAEFIEAEQVRKRFQAAAKSLVQTGPHWYLSEGRMDDLRQKTHTIIRITGVKSGEDLADRLFNPRTFYIGG